MPELGTSGSAGAGGGQPPSATRRRPCWKPPVASATGRDNAARPLVPRRLAPTPTARGLRALQRHSVPFRGADDCCSLRFGAPAPGVEYSRQSTRALAVPFRTSTPFWFTVDTSRSTMPSATAVTVAVASSVSPGNTWFVKRTPYSVNRPSPT